MVQSIGKDSESLVGKITNCHPFKPIEMHESPSLYKVAEPFFKVMPHLAQTDVTCLLLGPESSTGSVKSDKVVQSSGTRDTKQIILSDF